MRTALEPKALYWASFNRFELRIPGECVADCSGQGSADDAVAYWTPKIQAQVESDNFPNKPTPDKIRAELEECGAWDSEELANDDENWQWLVWIAACNISDDESPDCSDPVHP